MPKKVVAIDQGTTSSRAVLFDEKNNLLDFEQKEFNQYFPNDGWVEHDPEEIWGSVFDVTDKLLKKHSLKSSDIAGIGITNQRETTVVWDKKSGKAIYPAIVWQDRRTSDLCDGLRNEVGIEQKIQQKTFLPKNVLVHPILLHLYVMLLYRHHCLAHICHNTLT